MPGVSCGCFFFCHYFSCVGWWSLEEMGDGMADRGVVDRLSIRERPEGLPIMYQSWRKLLFMHWPLAPEVLRPFIPEKLRIDTYQGQAWIAVTPFIVRHARPVFFPPLPLLSHFSEINVRTYVHYEGVPGVWFFSLDASSVVAVVGARTAFHLPYHTADMDCRDDSSRITYRSSRLTAPQPVEFEAGWQKGDLLGEAAPDSLEFFLVERYCLYAMHGVDLYRSRIHHPPWKLQRAELLSCRSTMIEGQRLPVPGGTPLLHYSEIQDTAIWPIKRVG